MGRFYDNSAGFGVVGFVRITFGEQKFSLQCWDTNGARPGIYRDVGV